MTNRVISQAAIWIFLGTVLIVWFGCGDDSDDSSVDKPTVTEDLPTDDSSVDKPPTVVDAPTDNTNVDTPPAVVDAPTDNVRVDNPRTIVDAPTDNANVDTPPAVEDSPIDNTGVDTPPEKDAPTDDVIVEVLVGSLQGQVAQIENVQIHIHVLQNGAAVALRPS